MVFRTKLLIGNLVLVVAQEEIIINDSDPNYDYDEVQSFHHCPLMFNFYLENKDTQDWNMDAVTQDICNCDRESDAEYKNHEDYIELCAEALRTVSHCPPGGCQSTFDLSGLDGYGCWCNFGAELTAGHGNPVNIFDDICKSFQLCLRCVKFDAATDNYQCDPLTYTYNSLNTPSFQTDCSTANPNDDCGAHLCSCNVNFIQRLFSLLWSFNPDHQYDSSYLHSNGFSQYDKCELPPPNNSGEMDCCGYYPDRFPYNANNQAGKACCNKHFPYSTLSQECCNDEQVVDIGDCF